MIAFLLACLLLISNAQPLFDPLLGQAQQLYSSGQADWDALATKNIGTL